VVALRRHQQVIELVLPAVLLEQLDDLLELAAFGVGRGILRVLDVFEISLLEHIPKHVALAVLADKDVDLLLELRIVLAKCDRQLAARSHGRAVVNLDACEDLLPEAGEKVVDDGDWREAGVNHLEDVVVFEHVGRFDDHCRRLAARLQIRIEPRDRIEVGADPADEHFLAGEIVGRCDRRSTGPGHHDLIDVLARWLRQGRDGFDLRPDGDHGRDHVDLAVEQRAGQHAARHRHRHDVQLEIAGL
jgi:hypothetical protein